MLALCGAEGISLLRCPVREDADEDYAPNAHFRKAGTSSSYFFNYSDTPATRSGISMFPVLPTIGVEATF
jgi:hypothetical protein